ncbi:hypothetical protein GCM10008015_27980 [Flavobacterium palustre]|uniref:Uncharacterized protein n=1 Tax=Flavobacterium palustre TaxID=1476463 RepID=A0ABQ1HRY0_9FLAO|nr:hypothetical protein GCM10008015_27980 [Flavobacterium palustre]
MPSLKVAEKTIGNGFALKSKKQQKIMLPKTAIKFEFFENKNKVKLKTKRHSTTETN